MLNKKALCLIDEPIIIRLVKRSRKSKFKTVRLEKTFNLSPN